MELTGYTGFITIQKTEQRTAPGSRRNQEADLTIHTDGGMRGKKTAGDF